MNKIKILLLGGLMMHLSGLGQSAYFISHNGTDGATGSKTSPWKTVDFAVSQMAAGDTLYFFSGNYGNQVLGINKQGGPDVTFTKPTFFIEYPGETALFETLTLGSSECPFREKGCVGGWDENDGYSMSEINLGFYGFEIKKGANVSAKNVVFDRCIFKIAGPWNGSVAAIDRAAVNMKMATNVTVKNCEITETGWAVRIQESKDINVLNNDIHDITQDGVVIVTATGVLIEGNTIRNLYDGAGDNDGFDWNRHCDGIHMYPIIYSASADYGVRDITIRNNRFYYYEAMGVMMNAKKGSVYEFSNIVVENNLFYGGSGFAFHSSDVGIDGCIIRNNSVIDVPDDSFSMLNKTLYTTVLDVKLPSHLSRNVSVYNNIFAVPPIVNTIAAYDRYDHNSIYKSNGKELFAGLGYVNLDFSPFISPKNRDGAIAPDSPLVDAGTRLNATWSATDSGRMVDIHGTIRDNRPDIGAFEVPGRTPEPEELPNSKPKKPNTFRDDFSTGVINKINPFLYNDTTDVLTWKTPDGWKGYQVRLDRKDFKNNHIVPLFCQSGQFVIVSANSFKNVTIGFKSQPTLNYDINEGFLLLYVDENNYYYYDIIGGRFVKKLNGAENVISNSNALKQTVNLLHEISIKQSISQNSISIQIQLDGEKALNFTETDAMAYSKFCNGGSIGAMRNNLQTCHRTALDDFVVHIDNPEEITSINDISPGPKQEILVFPNPFTKNTTIKLPSKNKKYSLLLFDSSGKGIVSEHGITGNSYILENRNFKPGIYFLKITNNENETFCKKLVVR